jgi:hypothetical protein
MHAPRPVVSALLVLLTALATLITNTFLEHVRSRELFTTEIRKTQISHIAEVWEKLYMLEACVEDIVFVRNAATEMNKAGEPGGKSEQRHEPAQLVSHSLYGFRRSRRCQLKLLENRQQQR